MFDYSLDFKNTDLRKHPELYRIGKGEQGVLLVEPYEIASYGSARTWAEQLGLAKAVNLLQETLDEEKETDEKLSQLALSAVNEEAEEDEEERPAKGKKRVAR